MNDIVIDHINGNEEKLLKVGDWVTWAGREGYYKVVKLERQFVTKELLTRIPHLLIRRRTTINGKLVEATSYTRQAEIGDELDMNVHLVEFNLYTGRFGKPFKKTPTIRWVYRVDVVGMHQIYLNNLMAADGEFRED